MNKEEIKQLNISTRYFGFETDEEGEYDFEHFDDIIYQDEKELLEGEIEELFPNGANYKGEIKHSSYYGGKTEKLDINYTTEELKYLFFEEVARGARPVINEGVLMLPSEDLGGGIINYAKLEYVGEANFNKKPLQIINNEGWNIADIEELKNDIDGDTLYGKDYNLIIGIDENDIITNIEKDIVNTETIFERDE